jgi:predicted transcriptional regulator/DNA-binding XRE family transcriptional regulator
MAGLGAKVRTLRRRHELTQAKMAARLGISPAYLNLIEHDRRPLSASLLIKLVRAFDVDLSSFSEADDDRLEADLMEVFGDELFEQHAPTNTEVRELVQRVPQLARAVIHLYRVYGSLKEQGASGESTEGSPDSRLPSEEITELVQRRNNYFPELEQAAERLWMEARLDPADLWPGMVRYLESHGVGVRVVDQSGASGALRRYDPATRTLMLSEATSPGSRCFHLAVQTALLVESERLDVLATDPLITTPESRRLARTVLAGYFAGAVLMPYDRFLAAAKSTRYDIELLGHRFRTSFEQVCQRLASLARPGSEGVPFHFVKIDPAGNISKRFSGDGIRFARFGGTCPRWNVTRAFLRPHDVSVQVSRMPGGDTYFCVAKVIRRRHGGYHAGEAVHAVGIGCRLGFARELVYSDGIDLERIEDQVVPIGVTCRLCERLDCDQRAFPSVREPLRHDENVRGAGFYTVTK